MHNLATLYRFNTPFLDLAQERASLLSIKDKILLFLTNDGLEPKVSSCADEDYVWFVFEISGVLNIRFQYIKQFRQIYYMPIFQMDVFMNTDYILGNEGYKKTTLFLTSLFENFDGLNEKEYLMSIDKSIFYKEGLLHTKIFPHFDFSDLDSIQKVYEDNNGSILLENFITTFRDTSFVLNQSTAHVYHKIHTIILYYIYLVFAMHQSILQAQAGLDDLKDETNEMIQLSKIRFQHIKDLSVVQFQAYSQRLDTFFGLFR